MSKKQWKNVELNLQFSTAKIDWAQEEDDVHSVDVGSIRSNLPTQTNATRQQSVLENISSDGPFILAFQNIPYEAKDEDLRDFLRNCEIKRVIMNERKRGSGFIEFSNLQSLEEAYKMNDKMFNKRPIRLSLANPEDMTRLSGGSFSKSRNQGDFRSSQPSSNIDESDNWRPRRPATQPAAPVASTGNDDSNQSFNRRPQNSSWKSNTNQASNRKFNEPSPVAVTSGNTTSTVDDEDNWRRSSKSIKENSTSGEFASQPRQQHQQRSSRFNNNTSTAASNIGSTSTDGTNNTTNSSTELTFSRKPPKSDSAAATLLDSNSTATIATSQTDKPSTVVTEQIVEMKNLNIFGGAKPIDTSAKEREIEDKLEKLKVQTESKPVANAWNTKNIVSKQPSTNVSAYSGTPSTVPCASAVVPGSDKTLEWRSGSKPRLNIKKEVTSPHIKSSSIQPTNTAGSSAACSVSSTDGVDSSSNKLPAKKIPEPAPPPKVNIWEERKKSMKLQQQQQESNNSNSSGMNVATSQVTGVASPLLPSPTQTIETSTASPTTHTLTTTSIISNANNKSPPVVISANGPFINPKTTHKPPIQQSNQHLITDNTHKPPRVVPLSSSTTVTTSSVSAVVTATTGHSSSTNNNIQANIEAIKQSNPKSSWAKGPPKALVEKSLITDSG